MQLKLDLLLPALLVLQHVPSVLARPAPAPVPGEGEDDLKPHNSGEKRNTFGAKR